MINIGILVPCFALCFLIFVLCLLCLLKSTLLLANQIQEMFFMYFYHYQNNSGTVLRDYTCMSYDYWISVLSILKTN